MRIISLLNDTDFEGWRQASRQLLAARVMPSSVDWQVGPPMPTLFPDHLPPLPTDLRGHNFTVPARFIELCRSASLHSDPARFGLLYKLLWRLQLEPGLMRLSFDEDIRRVEMMVKAVRRDMHKMKAFVRFREVAAPLLPADAQGIAPHAPAPAPVPGSRFIAWFEPEHHIVAALAPFFTGRFTNMHWSILTPRSSMHWHDGRLYFTDGARREDAPDDDAGEALWRTYYSSIFNPARLKIKAMQAEMPKKYWRNLPEAALIASLIADADKRTQAMVDAPAQLPRRKIPKYVPVARPLSGTGGALVLQRAPEQDASLSGMESGIDD